MVDTKAEKDDDKGFGDFTFASFANHALHSDQIYGRKSTVNYNDDEWGNFVESPLQSELSSGLSTTQSLPNPSKPFDPFGFFPNQSNTPSQSATSPIELVLSHSGSKKTQWMKPGSSSGEIRSRFCKIVMKKNKKKQKNKINFY
ncbi:hypothetical protein HYC85_031366 [Camellia sinensis]|uniref:Uncharacterized protein n=1 Tax=Camellia sinensis TaxID=4442 RepID=A0A7J7FQE3_CAMSI|nr:hypothetical protein HYC85_031366 [Camellia sinensis]